MDEPRDQTKLAAPAGSPAKEVTDARSAPPCPSRGLGAAAVVLVSLTVSSAVSAGAIFFYDQHWAQKVVTADVPAFVEALREGVSAGLAPGEIQDRELRKLQTVLDAVPGHLVVISRDVVLRNADEVPLPALDFTHKGSALGGPGVAPPLGDPGAARP